MKNKTPENRREFVTEWNAQFLPPRKLFTCLLLSRLPHYLRAWANTEQNAMRKLLLHKQARKK